MVKLPPLVLGFMVGVLLINVVTDIRYRKVHNSVTIPVVLSGVMYHAAQYGLRGFMDSIAAIVLAIGVLAIPFLMGGLGGGDVKLLAGVGAWTLFPDIVWIFIIAGLLAGVCGFVLSLLKHRSLYGTMTEVLVLRHRMANVGAELDGEAWGNRKVTDGQPKRNLIPFALLIAIGTIARFFIVYRWG